MLDKPFGRRSLLRGAGALTAAAVAPWVAGCASDDDALTFFFAANPDEAAARMRVVSEFQRRHPDIKVRAVLSGPVVMQHHGFTVENICKQTHSLLRHTKEKS